MRTLLPRRNPRVKEIEMRRSNSLLASLLLAASLSLLPTGCVSTFKEVKPVTAGTLPATKPTALLVGELKVSDGRLTDTEKEAMARAFQSGVEKWLTEHKRLELLKNVAPTNLPSSAILLEGTITEIEKGSAAARFWVGMGAGQQRALGEFTVRGPDGARLTAFTARKSYLGGQGIGGWDMLKLEDLVGQLGQLVAETTDKWVSGAKIN
jgi:Domain of unknown function (DUF4410)